jgi:hypothetical protein
MRCDEGLYCQLWNPFLFFYHLEVFEERAKIGFEMRRASTTSAITYYAVDACFSLGCEASIQYHRLGVKELEARGAWSGRLSPLWLFMSMHSVTSQYKIIVIHLR